MTCMNCGEIAWRLWLYTHSKIVGWQYSLCTPTHLCFCISLFDLLVDLLLLGLHHLCLFLRNP